MKEILVWGDGIEEQFARIGVTATKTWEGPGWDDNDHMSVYEVSDEDLERLSADPEANWEEADCGWRYATGSNIISSPEYRATINRHHVKVWSRWQLTGERSQYWDGNRFDHILQYLCDVVGASQPRNVTACLVDLAYHNKLTLAQLMAKCQPARKVTS